MNKTLKTVIITALITFLITRLGYSLVLKQYDNEVTKKVAQINHIIEERGFYDVDKKTLADYAAAGMTLGIEDEYTNYFPKELFEYYLENLNNSSYVIGVVVSVDEENRIVVESVIEDSAAQKSGIKAGDVILEINSVKYTGDNLEEASSVMRGDDLDEIYGTELDLKILRDNTQHNIKIIREKVEYKSIKTKVINKNIGYLRIIEFYSSSTKDIMDTYDEFVEKLDELRSNGIEKLIIDLRNNPGGSMEVVIKIADELLPKGIITYTEDKYGKRREYKSDAKELDMPIVVLVNSDSASASEILTGALKDTKKATIVGTKTYGKGIVQTIIPFDDGSGMSITTSKYFTPNGVCIHDVGIEPDIIVEASEDFDIVETSPDEDVQLQKAIEIISR